MEQLSKLAWFRPSQRPLLATSTRHTGEWLTDRNVLRLKDLRNQPPARRHSPRTHSVQLSTATPRWNDCFKNQKPYASDEMPIQHDCTEAHRLSAPGAMLSRILTSAVMPSDTAAK